MKKIFILLFVVCSLSSTAQSFMYRDNDRDGYGDPNFPILYTELTAGALGELLQLNGGGYTANNTDCDDYNFYVNPGIIWYKDFDNDGFADGSITACYQPVGYKRIIPNPAYLRDCFDNDPSMNIIIWYTDKDGDGYKMIEPTGSYEIATYAPPIRSCTRPVVGTINFTPGFLVKGIDCNDINADIFITNWYLDSDGDGFPSADPPTPLCGAPVPPYYLATQLNSLAIDCDDNNVNIIPTTTWYEDQDNDGYTSGDSVVSCFQPTGYILNPARLEGASSLTLDCDDNDSLSFPFQLWIEDNDGDGYGKGLLVGGILPAQCERPVGRWFAYSELLGDNDCDDNMASIHPATEWCIDADNDGFYPDTKITQCSSPGPGYLVATTLLPGDCNDNDLSIRPNTLWVLDEDRDGYRNSLYFAAPGGSCTPPQDGRHYISYSKGADCDDSDADYTPETVWVMDKDGDGFYAGDSITGCQLFFIEGLVRKTNQQPGDCDDNDAAIGEPRLWVLDADGDGYHERLYIAQPGGSCAPPQDGRHYITNSKGSDCNDNDATDNPETVWVMDADGDGYYTGEPYTGCFFIFTPGYVRKATQLPGDCNDNDGTVHTPLLYYVDDDRDGYGSTATAMLCSSTATVGYAVNNTDCNDNNAAINPANIWIRDADADGYYAGAPVTSCTSPGTAFIIKSTQLAGDCMDNNAAVNPAAVEVCGNIIDDNCNGLIDEAGCNPCRNATNFQTTNITSGSAQLNWTAIANAVQWQVQYKTTKQGSKWVDVFVTGNKRFVILTGLLTNQNYQWQIRAKCGNTWTAYSVSVSFKTAAAASFARSMPTTDELEEPLIPAISLYPNPGNGIFNLRLQLSSNAISGTAVVSVMDMAGRKIYTEKCSVAKGLLYEKIRLPAGALQGVYLVEVIIENSRYVSKLVLIK